jgi:hypothetical protein
MLANLMAANDGAPTPVPGKAKTPQPKSADQLEGPVEAARPGRFLPPDHLHLFIGSINGFDSTRRQRWVSLTQMQSREFFLLVPWLRRFVALRSPVSSSSRPGSVFASTSPAGFGR